MPASTLVGTWVNEFGSILTITAIDQQTGVLSGTYASHTGATKVDGFAPVPRFFPSRIGRVVLYKRKRER